MILLVFHSHCTEHSPSPLKLTNEEWWTIDRQMQQTTTSSCSEGLAIPKLMCAGFFDRGWKEIFVELLFSSGVPSIKLRWVSTVLLRLTSVTFHFFVSSVSAMHKAPLWFHQLSHFAFWSCSKQEGCLGFALRDVCYPFQRKDLEGGSRLWWPNRILETTLKRA